MHILTIIVILIVAITVWYLYQLAVMVYKLKKMLRTEEVANEEMDKIISENVKKIAQLEWMLSIYGNTPNTASFDSSLKKPTAPKNVNLRESNEGRKTHKRKK